MSPLFTIGYEHATASAVLDEIARAGVGVVIDVRAIAASRRPGFSKRQFSAALDERGIGYLHLRGLGTPKEGRLAARAGDVATLFQIYNEHLKTAQAREELDELTELVRSGQRICLVCYERDPDYCHRKRIAALIRERTGVAVEHLFAPPFVEAASGEALAGPRATEAPLRKENNSTKSAAIRVGIGGWTFAPWRGVFYPQGLAHAQELAFASTHLTSIEINGTFYRTQTPATFRKWAQETPEGFVFSVKGPRYVTQRHALTEAGESIRRFCDSGVVELGDRLGPILWQFAPTKKFDEADFGGFLELLPREWAGRALRHVVEVRHGSFRTPAFTALLRGFDTPVVFAEHHTYPAIADVTGGFVYARLQMGKDSAPTGYPPAALDAWAQRVRVWAAGREPDDLPRVEPDKHASVRPREVFVYFIHEGKVRAPAAAMALIERLRQA